MSRALRIAASVQGFGWLLIIFWFFDSTPSKSSSGLILGILCFLLAAPFVYIDHKYKRRY